MAAIGMNKLTFKVLNGPVCIFNLVAYIFYAFCLFRRQDGADVPKQPLKVLLGTLVMFTTALQMNSLFYVFFDFSDWQLFVVVVDSIQFYLFLCTLATVVWVNVFYYTRIVPPHSTFTIWLKKNLKCVVCSVVVSDKLFFLADTLMYGPIPLFISNNSTLTSSNTHTLLVLQVFFVSRVVYAFLNLMVMTASSYATVSYLRRHLRNMKLSRRPITSSLQNQKRVVVAGIVQIVLYFLCATWFILDHLFVIAYPGLFDGEHYIMMSVFSLYCFGTALNLGVGQSLFRRRTASLCHKMSEFMNL